MRIVIATVMLACLCTASAQQSQQLAPFVPMEKGDRATCRADEGCVAMSRIVFQKILQEAIHHGEQSCRNAI